MARRKRRDWGRGWVETRARATGVRYVARWREGAGTRSKTFDKEEAAWDFLDDRARDLRRRVVQAGPVTVGDVVRAWQEANRYRWAESTTYTYARVVRLHIAPAWGSVAVDAVTPGYLRSWVEGLRLHYSDTMVRNIGTVLGAALRYGLEEGMLARSPLRRGWLPSVSTPEPETLWERGHIGRVLNATRDDAWWHAFYAVLWGTGMRRGELLALRWEDVNLERGELRVWRTVSTDIEGRPIVVARTKTGEGRALVMTRTARAALSALPRRGELVFGRDDGGLYDDTTLANNHMVWCGKAGVPHIPVHDVRHSVATILLADGVDVKVVSALLGHARSATTIEIYQHVTPALARLAVERLEECPPDLPNGSEESPQA